MKKFFIFILFLNFLYSCQSVSDGFKLKKKDTADEFLVEKKNPLVLPPNYNDLPTPKSINSSNEEETESFEKSVSGLEKDKSSESDTKSTSTAESILKNINKDESN